jgi:hypothetical protein
MIKFILTILLCLLPLNAFAGFPTTGILDNFNRANEGPPLSSSWTTDPEGYGATGHKVLSNQAVGSGTIDNDSRYNVSTFGPDMEGYFTCVTKPGDGDELSIIIRATGTTGGTFKGYQLSLLPVAGTDTLVVYSIVNGTYSVLATYTEEIVNGYKYGISAVGTTITTWRDNGTGWVSVGSVVNSAVTGAGYVQMYSLNNVATFDDVGGGLYRRLIF